MVWYVFLFFWGERLGFEFGLVGVVGVLGCLALWEDFSWLREKCGMRGRYSGGGLLRDTICRGMY